MVPEVIIKAYKKRRQTKVLPSSYSMIFLTSEDLDLGASDGKEHMTLSFWVRITSFNIIFSSSLNLP